MSARYLTNYPLDGYLHTRLNPRISLRRNKFNLHPLIESVGWVVAGASVGIAAVMMGAWGLLQLTEPHVPQTATAMNYQVPALTPDR